MVRYQIALLNKTGSSKIESVFNAKKNITQIKFLVSQDKIIRLKIVTNIFFLKKGVKYVQIP